MHALTMALLLLAAAAGPDSSGVQTYTTTLTISTYPYTGFLETHHADAYNIDYPWLDRAAYDASGPQPVARDYTAVVLENDWLRLTFLPELGGRLYGVTDRATGEELLYQNPVVKPTHWGPNEQPWWLAVGGIEWCLPVDEHGYEWAVPWGYQVDTAPEGATITLWDSTAEDRIRARISVFLPADRAAFDITPRLENPTAAPVTFKFWINAMLAPGAANTVGRELRFVLPIDQVTVHSAGNFAEHEVLSWPVHGGVDYSRLGNWDRWLGVFARPAAQEDWAGVYANGVRRGVARIFPHDVAVGLKAFGFGWAAPIDWHNWTDDGSTYVELHGGPAPTFWDSVTLPAGQSLSWTETWLPLRDLPALSLATDELALGWQQAGQTLHLGLQSPRPRTVTARVWRLADCSSVWQEDGIELVPGQATTRDIAGLVYEPDEMAISILEDGNLLLGTTDQACWPPQSSVHALSSVQAATSFPVSWSATGTGGELAGFDVQVRDGDCEAAWTGWLTGTSLTSATFHGQDGHTYTFRSRARDQVGHVEAWPDNPWGDAFTTVLLAPAPVLITSAKVVQPLAVHPGELLEFEVRLINSGNLAAETEVRDPLPPWLELAGAPWTTAGYPPPAVVSDTVTWAGTVPPGEEGLSIGFAARLLFAPPGGVVLNTAWIDDGRHEPLVRQVVAHVWLRLYLPLVLRTSQ